MSALDDTPPWARKATPLAAVPAPDEPPAEDTPPPLAGADWTPKEETTLDLERALLGCLLIGTTDTPTTASDHGIDRTTWLVARHEIAWTHIARLARDGITPDQLLVADAIHGAGEARAYGGRPEEYLAGCIALAPTHHSTGHYAEKVAAHARTRARTDLTRRLTDLADQPDRYDQALADWLTDRGIEQAGASTTTSWDPVDLATLIDQMRDDGYSGPQPTVLNRRDGPCLLYPGAIHSVSGEPASGKTWVALVGVAQQAELGNPTLVVDFEDRAQTLIARLWALGLTDQQIADHVRYVRPHDALTPDTWTRLAAKAEGCTLAIVDGITEAMTLHGLSLMDNEDVARWLALIPRRLADLGPAVLQIDHVVKDSESRGRYAIGGQHKLAGIDGVAYKMVTAKPMGKGQRGLARIVIDKDRHGEVGPTGATAAELHFDATNDDGTILAWLDEPRKEHTDDGQWRPTGYMDKVSRWLEGVPGASGRAIVDAIPGTDKHVKTALQVLIDEGWIRTEQGPKRAVLHYVVTPFREETGA